MSLGKLVGLVLGGACGLLALVATALFFGVGTGIDPADPSEQGLERPIPDVDGDAAVELPDAGRYLVVAQRPLFNESRQPEEKPAELVGEDVDGDETTDEPPPPLDVEVKGIIIAPDVRLAIVTDPRSKSTQRVREGMPLEGELAAWTLAEISPRNLVFDGAGGERAEVELVVNTQALKGAPPVTNRNSRAADAAESEADDSAAGNGETEEMDPEARAEEIRRRVAERRAQLREEAERRRAQREENEEQ